MRELLREGAAELRSRRASDRLLDLAAGLEYPSEHTGLLTLLFEGDGVGGVRLSVHTDAVHHDIPGHLLWVGEDVAAFGPLEEDHRALPQLDDISLVHELVPAFDMPETFDALGLPDPLAETQQRGSRRLWPVPVALDGMDLMRALTSVRAQVRVHLTPATDLQRAFLAEMTRSDALSSDPVIQSAYVGSPVCVRTFVAQSGDYLSPRLRAAVHRMGIGLKLRQLRLDEDDVRAAWEGERRTLAGSVRPFGAAQAFLRIPACGPEPELCGLPTTVAPAPMVPLSLDDAETVRQESGGLRLGVALDGMGGTVEVRFSRKDLLLHTQILGATGSGKSTLLAAMVQEAIEQGMGVTVLESHGPLVERILDELPSSAVPRTWVVRSGDIDHPVPVNPLAGEDPEAMADIFLGVLYSVFDPKGEGVIGPRFETLYADALAGLSALFPGRSTPLAIPWLLRSREFVAEAVKVIATIDAEAAERLTQSVVRNNSSEVVEVLNWVNAKFTRFTHSPELRAIMGTGANAVDVQRVLDEGQVLLVDLDEPALGRYPSRMLGEIWLALHWAALSRRPDPTRPHLLVVDEAHAFRSDLLPRFLAEARKFGVGVVLAHQNMAQLSESLRSAVLSTTNSVAVFRSGPIDAPASVFRLGGWSGGLLTRLPRMQAAATVSAGARQTEAFTLVVDHNERMDGRTGDRRARGWVEERSRAVLAEPYRGSPQLSPLSVQARITRPSSDGPVARPPGPRPTPGRRDDFIDQWLVQHQDRQTTPDPGSLPADG